MAKDKYTSGEYQRAVGDMVGREVFVCVSGLVCTLANGAFQIPTSGDGLRDLGSLCEQAFELSSGVPDYEEAARQEGWGLNDDGDYENATGDDAPRIFTGGEWQELCEEYGIEPDQSEAYEHWAVSEWFARKLEAHGEKVDFDFAGMTVWGRTCTGQAIKLDRVICDIYDEVYAKSGEYVARDL